MLIQQLEEMAKLKLDQWNTQTRKTDSTEEGLQSFKVHHSLRLWELVIAARNISLAHFIMTQALCLQATEADRADRRDRPCIYNKMIWSRDLTLESKEGFIRHFPFPRLLQILFSVWSEVVPDMIKQTDNQKQTPPSEKLWSSILNENSWCITISIIIIRTANTRVTFYFRVSRNY